VLLSYIGDGVTEIEGVDVNDAAGGTDAGVVDGITGVARPSPLEP
jgi:hypothetical protein